MTNSISKYVASLSQKMTNYLIKCQNKMSSLTLSNIVSANGFVEHKIQEA